MRKEHLRIAGDMNEKSFAAGIDAVLTGSLIQSRHVLFLYTSHVNSQAIRSFFFAVSNHHQEIVHVTSEMAAGENLPVIPPENIDDLGTMGSRLGITMDMAFDKEGATHKKLEEFLRKNKNSTALCMCDLSRLEPERLRMLVASHDRLILSTPNITVLSGDVSDATIERFVKDYLDMVVLALIASKPMCGIDILDIIHKNFNVLLSPGTVYPLLHRLKEKGLLECEHGFKRKIYRPARGSEANIRSILDEHLTANEFLNEFLKSRGMEAGIS